MSKIIRFIFILGIIIMSANVSASAQRYKRMCCNPNERHIGLKPRFSVRPHRPTSAIVSYDAASTTLTVKFPSNSQGGTVEVYRDGAKVAGITTNGGTTFSCRLHEYGAGNYNVIVSNGNTVVDSKNYIIK